MKRIIKHGKLGRQKKVLKEGDNNLQQEEARLQRDEQQQEKCHHEDEHHHHGRERADDTKTGRDQRHRSTYQAEEPLEAQ